MGDKIWETGEGRKKIEDRNQETGYRDEGDLKQEIGT